MQEEIYKLQSFPKSNKSKNNTPKETGFKYILLHTRFGPGIKWAVAK